MKKTILLLAIGLFVGLSNSCSSDDRVTNNDDQNLQNPDDPNNPNDPDNPDNPNNLSLLQVAGCRVSKVTHGEEKVIYYNGDYSPVDSEWDWEAEGWSWEDVKDRAQKKITKPSYGEYVYDEQGKVISTINYGQLEEVITFSGESTFYRYYKSVTDFIYHHGTDLIKEKTINIEYETLDDPVKRYITGKTFFYYNDKKQLIEILHYDNINESREHRTIQEYDSEGNVYRRTISRYYGYNTDLGSGIVHLYAKQNSVYSNFEYENGNLLKFFSTIMYEAHPNQNSSRYITLEYSSIINIFYNHISCPALLEYIYDNIGFYIDSRTLLSNYSEGNGSYIYTFTENELLESVTYYNEHGDVFSSVYYEYDCQ